MSKHNPPLVIGIAGGTGSGKTTVVNEILKNVGENLVSYIPHDAYYKEFRELPPIQKANINYDHPNSLDTELMIQHVELLKQGKEIHLPIYDFTTHSRTSQTITIHPKPVILVEGILIFYDEVLRNLCDVKIFVDTDPDIRLIRRIRRDISERGRTIESVLTQYETTVRPMHLKFVEPAKRYADVIIPEGGYNQVALDMVIARIETLVRRNNQTNPKENSSKLIE